MQEGLAAVFGNGLSTACVINLGAQVTSVICIEVGMFWSLEYDFTLNGFNRPFLFPFVLWI